MKIAAQLSAPPATNCAGVSPNPKQSHRSVCENGPISVSSHDLQYKSLLFGKIFDDHGHAMTPTHANKKGVRYRYHVSQALLQGRKAQAGSVARIPAPDVEGLVIDAVRQQTRAIDLQPAADAEAVDPQGAARTTTLTIPFAPALPLHPRPGELRLQMDDPHLLGADRFAGDVASLTRRVGQRQLRSV